MGERRPFAVYVHWPFCAQKCPYCDFNSHVRHGGWDEAAYLAAYLRELDLVRKRVGERRTHSVFIGGGTPSLMQPGTVGGLLDRINSLWPLEADAEITIEANPGSVEADRFAGYRAAGVNRVSIGVQSLRDEDLRTLGRIHSVAEARRAIDIAQRTFQRTSFDMIYARPKQTVTAWERELREVLDIAGSHLSLYQLTIEPQTTFEKLYMAGKLEVPDGDTSLALYELTQSMTAAAGLPAYEVSNHARPGEESRHNLVYWRYGEYAGVGPGAHGRLDVDGKRFATVTEKSPEAWLKRVVEDGSALIENEALDARAEADEMLLMGMRLSEGFDLTRLAARGFAIETRVLDHMRDLGLIEPVGNTRIRATPQGRLVLNRLVAELSQGMK